HVRVSVAEHPDALIAEIRRRRYELGAPDLREALLHLRVIERRVVDAAGLTAGATDEHCAHTPRSIACYTASAFGGLVVGVGMNGQQATRTGSGVTIDAEYFRLWSPVVHRLVRHGIVRAVQRWIFPPGKYMHIGKKPLTLTLSQREGPYGP